MGVRADIERGLADRLETMKSSNGYTTDIQKVFAEEIPMGMDLDEFEMPGILVIPSDESHTMEHQQLVAQWEFEIQLIHGDVSDSVMHQFVRDVYKCIWANSATASTNRPAFKWQKNITHVLPGTIETDLNMIEANRLWILTIVVHYRSRLTDI